MNKNSTFSSERLWYRGLSESDTDYLVVWRSDPKVIQYFRQSKPLTRMEHEQWYRNTYSQDLDRYDFLIIEKKTKRAIGTAGVNHIDYKNRSCEVSYMIAESNYQRKGYAVESIRALMDQMIREGICCFFAEIHSENFASRRTIEKMKYTYYSERPPFIIYYRQESTDDFYTD